jgi:hypothetical protein
MRHRRGFYPHTPAKELPLTRRGLNVARQLELFKELAELQNELLEICDMVPEASPLDNEQEKELCNNQETPRRTSQLRPLILASEGRAMYTQRWNPKPRPFTPHLEFPGITKFTEQVQPNLSMARDAIITARAFLSLQTSDYPR